MTVSLRAGSARSVGGHRDETKVMTDSEIQTETAKFTDTGKTVVHRGRTFAILNPPSARFSSASPYILRSTRGKWYALMRNKPKPHLLFGVGLYGPSFKCLDGWFSDQSGELISLG